MAAPQCEGWQSELPGLILGSATEAFDMPVLRVYALAPGSPCRSDSFLVHCRLLRQVLPSKFTELLLQSAQLLALLR